MLRLSIRSLALVLLLSSVAGASAATSLKLGAVFPGWDQVRSGPTYDAAGSLARDYARQIGHFCGMPEVFVRERTTSIVTALVFYEGFLPFGASERMLLNSVDQRVTLVSSRTLMADVLSVMVATRSGVVLVLC